MISKLGIGVLFLFTAVSSADWPRWRGPEGDGGWNPPELPADFASREPVRLWKEEIGGGYGGVTMAAGCVYVMDRPKEPADTERLHCFQAESGKKLWTREWTAGYGSMDYGTGPRSSVTIHEGKIYALGAVGMALCADAVTGLTIWQVDMVKEHAARVPTWGFAGSPVIDGPRVLLHVGAEPLGCVIALERMTGRLVWRGGPDAAGYCTPEIISHGGKQQLIVWGPDHVQSLDPATGATFWTWPYPITYGVSIAQPLYRDGVLLVSGYWHGTKALRLGTATGEVSLAWENEKDICGLMSGPLFKDGAVYLLDKNKGLQAFELATGKIFWSDTNTLTPKDRNPHMSIVWTQESDGLASLLNADGELVHLKLSKTGFVELSRHQIIGKTWAHPAFSGEHIWVRSDTELAAWRVW
jgi:outer membrane protein assembly factor BamB